MLLGITELHMRSWELHWSFLQETISVWTYSLRFEPRPKLPRGSLNGHKNISNLIWADAHSSTTTGQFPPITSHCRRQQWVSPGIFSSALLYIYFPAVSIAQGLSRKYMFLFSVWEEVFFFFWWEWCCFGLFLNHWELGLNKALVPKYLQALTFKSSQTAPLSIYMLWLLCFVTFLLNYCTMP